MPFSSRFVIVTLALTVAAVSAGPSAMELVQDMYNTCLQDFSTNCIKPKAIHWMSKVAEDPVIKITEDLLIVKKDSVPEEDGRSLSEDIFDKFEDFLQSHELVAKVPEILRADGPAAQMIPRSFEAEDVKMPLAVTGRSSKLVKKVIMPFLLGLKFKTAVLVPLALALIALKTWKALTLGLLSFVLTGAIIIFKFAKPKVVNYEVIHYPHHDVHHVDHHVDHAVPTGWEHQGYGRQLNAQEMAYNAYAPQ